MFVHIYLFIVHRSLFNLMNSQGVFPILPTPFTDTGAVDITSLRRLIHYQKAAGVSGVAILGFMGEIAALNGEERASILQAVMEEARALDLEVWVGVRAFGTIGCAEQAQIAQSYGADAVFVAPIQVQNDDVLYEHYKTVAASVAIPVMIHDYPPSFAVTISAELIARLANDGICPSIKLEEAPIGPKLTKVRKLTNDDIAIFGGLGGIYFLEELERGAQGIATGFSFPQVLVRIFDLYQAGDVEAARRTFDHYASLLRYEFQPKIGLAYRKHVYHQRGVFSSPFVRTPGIRALDALTSAEFERTIKRAGLHLGMEPLNLV